MDKAVVLASGGINSSVAAAVAREEYEPALLHVAWGHRAADRELIAFQQIATALRIEKTMVAELSCMAMFGGNARVSKRLSVVDTGPPGNKPPPTFMIGLLPSMLSVAAAWAAALRAKRIIIGISEDHGVPGRPISEVYPDYRIEFLQTFNLMLSYAKHPEVEILAEAPLIDLTRTEVIRLGQRLGVPFERTWSCYKSDEKPCGLCRACATRAAGFLSARIPDPIMLEEAAAPAR